ncbi:Methionyl-tRNA formyltransferase [Buchnera aphidicola (Eriosoma lanigerum)]|uniref:methionyl-tRNA formyltransferase n=1 Tax=Buchnera aphidicola TaxID=9 RepID=UPI00346426B7
MLKIIFAGTPEFSAQHLNELIKSKYNIVAVLTKPDQPSGRGNQTTFSPVKKIAKKHNIPIFQPNILNYSIQSSLSCFNANIMIVVAYGLILPKIILNMFPMGCINIHASLLPRWRGPSPIHSALLAGDKFTGITIIKMDNNIDTGDILYSRKCNITNIDTTKSLTKKLIQLGIQCILVTLTNIIKKIVIYQRQDHLISTYSKKIQKIDAKINWNNEAQVIDRMIRAYNPWPISYFIIHNIRIKIFKAQIIPNYIYKEKCIGKILSINKEGINIQTATDIIQIQEIQFPGKKIITSIDIYNSKKKWFIPESILK